ncbi:MAG: hypothetical protein AAF806_02810 [Bacteroidota bacterium]
MKQFFLLSSVLLLLTASDCKKGIENNSMPPICYVGTDYYMINSIFNSSNSKTDYFEYDSLGKILSVDEYWDEEFLYDSLGRVVSIVNYSESDKSHYWIDSILYTPEGRIDQILHYNNRTKFDRKNMAYGGVRYFRYNDIDSTITTYSVSGTDRVEGAAIRYYWSKGNIFKKEEYRDDELQYSFVYKYDNEINYKKNHPYFIRNPLNWTNNNVIAKECIYNLSSYQSTCYDWQYQLEYDPIGLPLKIEREDGQYIKMPTKSSI